MASIAIAQTKSLDLAKKLFSKITPEQFSVLLDLCAGNLEKIEMGYSVNFTDLVAALANYSCPRLIDLKTTRFEGGNDLFMRVVRNNLNLKSLTWWTDPKPNASIVVYPYVINEKLESLDVQYCNDLSICSLTGRCPNLKSFTTWAAENISADIIDNFLASVLKLETLVMHLEDSAIALDDDLTYFWRLENLSALRISSEESSYSYIDNDTVLEKISTHFPACKCSVCGIRVVKR